MENKTKIILTRKSEWMNRARAFKVIIDGIEKEGLPAAQLKNFLLTPVSTRLFANWDGVRALFTQ